MKDLNTPLKTNRILNFFLAGLLLILLRVWFLTAVKHDALYLESRKPQMRTVIDKVDRGLIEDRFHIPLALNKTQYNATILYADIRHIPRIIWEGEGKVKKKRFARREHIEKLSHYLATTLAMDPQLVEDMIHGKASLFPHTPFTLKEDIPEPLYYKLKAQEKDWIGLRVQQTAKRVYPKGKLACDVVGYMGAIGPSEYGKVAQELSDLKSFLEDLKQGEPVPLPKGFATPQEVEGRYEMLKELSYTINDLVGKSGVEAIFDETLRGHNGKKNYEVDINGTILSELPGGVPGIPGETLTLSLSAELQEEAEKLLAEYEEFQEVRDKAGTKQRRSPWQKGGAIVAMDPHTGEILALASYPRFDPNDFVPTQSRQLTKEKKKALIGWLENEAFIGEVWDGKRPLEKERFKDGHFVTESFFLDWEKYIDTILPPTSSVRKKLDQIESIAQAVFTLQKQECEGLSHPKDQKLFLDLLQLVVGKEVWPSSLLEYVGDLSLPEFRRLCQTAAKFLEPLKETAQALFHEGPFKTWREKNFVDFITQMRRAEKKQKKYTRPYTDYLDKKEQELFSDYWNEIKYNFLYTFLLEEDSDHPASVLRKNFSDPQLDTLHELLLPMKKSERLSFLKQLRTFEDLSELLNGQYRLLRSTDGIQLEKHLAAGFYPYSGFGCGRSQAFRQASPMGSIFKVITGYAGLKHQYLNHAPLNPLTLVDDMQWVAKKGSNSQVLGYFENGEPIKRLYKGGRLPRAYPNIGKIGLPQALERTSNIYFSILAGDVLKSPNELLEAALDFGLGSPTGIDLPGEYGGKLPDDLLHNKTGLYSFAIGQHSLVVTPLQTATALAAIANGGHLLKPQVIKSDQPQVRHAVFLPDEIRSKLIEGMHLVTNGAKGTARLSLIRGAFHDKEALAAYKTLHPQMIGKTGTAEIMFKQTLDSETEAQMEKHVWFGSVSFEDKALQKPDLVVVVYLRFGAAGKQGAPIAAHLTQKWRKIKASH